MPLTSGWQGYCLKSAKELKPIVGDQFDMLTCSGISGQCVGFYVAVALEIPLLLVRKEPTKSGAYSRNGVVDRVYCHDGYEIIEFWQKHNRPPRVCFLDDWIAGGGTRRETCIQIHKAGGDCTFEYLYAGSPSRTQAQIGPITDYTRESFGPVYDPRTGLEWTPPKPKPVRAAAAKKPVARKRVATKKAVPS